MMKKILPALITIAFINTCFAQDTIINGIKYPKPVNFTAQQNQDNMMQQLGITKLRPGPSGNESAHRCGQCQILYFMGKQNVEL